MSAAPLSPFSAASSAAGYLYQCRYALLLLLRRSRVDSDAQIALEKFDDISFENAGTPTELIQTKHHLGQPPSLSDGSTDLWKTLRVWSESLSAGNVVSSTTIFTIITSASAPTGSAAALLRDGPARNPDAAYDLLVAAAKRGTGEELRNARRAFLAIDDAPRRELVRSIHVLDNAPNVVDLQVETRAEIVRTVRDQHVTAFHERLEGWWFNEIILRLAGRTTTPITALNLSSFIDDLRDAFRADSLPIDFSTAKPADLDVADNRTYVQQLRLIEISDAFVRWARVDYFRAYAQRSRWLSDNLLVLRQLETYDTTLVEELERERDRHTDDSTADAIQKGKSLFDYCYANCRPIRPNCTEPYVGRGSYHMLADRKQIGWHPDYKRLLEAAEALAT